MKKVYSLIDHWNINRSVGALIGSALHVRESQLYNRINKNLLEKSHPKVHLGLDVDLLGSFSMSPPDFTSERWVWMQANKWTALSVLTWIKKPSRQGTNLWAIHWLQVATERPHPMWHVADMLTGLSPSRTSDAPFLPDRQASSLKVRCYEIMAHRKQVKTAVRTSLSSLPAPQDPILHPTPKNQATLHYTRNSSEG